MSATMQQQQLSSWDDLMQRYPTFHATLSTLGAVLGYFIHGHIVVALGRWVVLTSGRIAETAMLFATLWVTAASVAPTLTAKLGQLSSTLSDASMMALTLLPEIILFSAIVTCYGHWQAAIQQKEHRVSHGVWAGLYTLPTITFLAMTIYTLCSFISAGHTSGADSTILTIRCLAGWSYGLIGLIHAGIGKQKHVTVTPSQPIDYDEVARQIVPLVTPALLHNVTVTPEPIDYDRLISGILPHLEKHFSDTGKSATVTPDSSPLPRATTKTRNTTPLTPAADEVLERTYLDMLASGEKPSGRALSAKTGINRNKTNDWFKAKVQQQESEVH